MSAQATTYPYMIGAPPPTLSASAPSASCTPSASPAPLPPYLQVHDKCTIIGNPEEGDGTGGFGTPSSVVVMHDGHVVVSDSKKRRLYVFDPQLRFVRGFSKPDQQVADGCPTAMCSGRGDQRGTLLVSELWYERIQLITVNGDWMECWCDRIDIIQCPGMPRGLCVDSCNNIYVGIEPEHHIVVFSWDGDILRTIGTHGSRPGQLHMPVCLCIDDDNDLLFVTDGLNNRVQAFTSTGECAHVICLPDSPREPMSLPTGLHVFRRGHKRYIAVADATHCRVVVYEWNGKRERRVAMFGAMGDGPRQFRLPVGVCTDASGRLLVADADNHRVQVIEPSTDSRVALLGCLLSAHLTSGRYLPDCVQ